MFFCDFGVYEISELVCHPDANLITPSLPFLNHLFPSQMHPNNIAFTIILFSDKNRASSLSIPSITLIYEIVGRERDIM